MRSSKHSTKTRTEVYVAIGPLGIGRSVLPRKKYVLSLVVSAVPSSAARYVLCIFVMHNAWRIGRASQEFLAQPTPSKSTRDRTKSTPTKWAHNTGRELSGIAVEPPSNNMVSADEQGEGSTSDGTNRGQQ